MADTKMYPEGCTVHRDGAVTLSGPFGARGVVGYALAAGNLYAMHDRQRVRLVDVPMFKTRKAAVLWLLENLSTLTPRDPGATFELESPDIVGALRVSAQRLEDRGAGVVHGVCVATLMRDAALEIEGLRPTGST